MTDFYIAWKPLSRPPLKQKYRSGRRYALRVTCIKAQSIRSANRYLSYLSRLGFFPLKNVKSCNAIDKKEKPKMAKTGNGYVSRKTNIGITTSN